MSSTDRQAKIQAASKGSGKGANAILVGGIVAIVAVIAVVAAVIWSSQKDSVEAGGPPAGTQMGQPYNPYPDAKLVDGAPTVDVYEDVRCPACKVYEQFLGSDVSSLAKSGKIKLNVHLKTVIDSNFNQTNSATTASSLMCAADEGKYTEFHDWLFANQPQEPDEFTDAQLVEAAKAAGLSGDSLDTWQQCTDAKKYQAYVKSVDDQAAKDGFTGTPALVVNGTKVNWGSFVSDDGSQVDTKAFTEVLTSGDVPADRVAKE